MGLVVPLSQIRQRGVLNTLIRIGWAVGLVLILGSLGHHFSSKPSGLLLSCAVAVMLAAMMNGTQSAIAALITAALLSAYWLPPSNSLAIAPPFRFGYGVFLVLCTLISFYRPPMGASLVEPREAIPDLKPYTEEDLPTVLTAEKVQALPAWRVIEGNDLYQWERACAHLSDLVWDAQLKLQEEDVQHAYVLLKHAYEVASQTRAQIEMASLSPETKQPPEHK